MDKKIQKMNCMNKIDTIIFDLGGVMVDWNPEYVYKNVFKDTEKMDWFLTNVCSSEWNMEQDGGRTIAEAEQLKIKEFPNYEKEIKIFYKEWHHMFKGVIQENIDIFYKLKASGNFKIYGLTNWSAEKWDKALELFPFLHDFDEIVVSGQEKCRKPNLKIYHLILDRYSINPEKAIFVDDNIDNIIAAKKVNINGIHFTNNSSLFELLEPYNLNF